jgi:acetylornithine deacetylase/succinyl-diaminopimelate desuccinylase-like protein
MQVMLLRGIIIAAVGMGIIAGGGEWVATAQDSITPPDFTALIEAADVMVHVESLAGEIGARGMGSEAEAQAATYIADQFEAWGYTVEILTFGAGGDVISRNVIATRAGTAQDGGRVVIGAHMDSVSAGTGAGDNASGVAAMLAAAEALAGYETERTLVFVAFGAEEGGHPSGAEAYVESLGETVEHVIAMINIDSVGIGTDLNVYAGTVVHGENRDGSRQFTGGPVWVRDLALDLAAEMGLPFGTTPPESWNGFTGAWSDHYAFVLAGVPIAYFEAWYWTDVADPWWGQETPEGDYLHTERDVVTNVVPEKVEMTAEVVAATVYAISFTTVYTESAEGDQDWREKITQGA